MGWLAHISVATARTAVRVDDPQAARLAWLLGRSPDADRPSSTEDLRRLSRIREVPAGRTS